MAYVSGGRLRLTTVDGRDVTDGHRGLRELAATSAPTEVVLDGLGLSGPAWQTPPYFPGAGRAALRTAREQGLGGVVAKRLDAAYRPGPSRDWLSVEAR